MRKSFFIAPIFALALAVIFFIIPGSSQSMGEGLYLISPESCPEGGCAAGQRLNFTVEFTATEGNGVCVYAPTGWAASDSISIAAIGNLSGAIYSGDAALDNSCNEIANTGEIYLAGIYVPDITVWPDQLDFSLTIAPTTTIDNGNVVVKIIDPGVSPSTLLDTHDSEVIEVADLVPPVYVADTPDDCNAHSPCFVNTLEDGENGLGTALRDAVSAVNAGATVRVLGSYPVKDHTVLIDKSITLTGYLNSGITYLGSVCGSPMLSITTDATIQNLTIEDGACDSPSRVLLQVNSPSNVNIEHNTLLGGKYAVEVKNNDGEVLIVFNEILDNDSFGILSSSGSATGKIWAYANNIIGNGSGTQMLCNFPGNADHNYWGESQLAEDNVETCEVSNDKQLGAPILESSNSPGVEALEVGVTTGKIYYFNNKIAVSRSGGSEYNLVIVNHGQGSTSNIPFYDAVGDSITPCSNFYDLFTVDGAAPSDLVLTLKYDLNTTCLSTIETTDYCGGSDSADFPLWWYDPANNVTDKWDTVGQSPAGSGAGGATGQMTTCNTTANEIQVTIDNTGRPGLTADLSFTPFFTGYPSLSGIELSQLTASFDTTGNEIKWTTTEERNIKGFHILRADTQNGPYSRISPLIQSIGDTYIGGIYTYFDTNITFTRTYYYKLEVISDSGASIESYGPVSVLTSTATPTATATRTKTPTRTVTITRTPTPYYYRSPTSYYRPATSTPRSGPTQVRTYGATRTATGVTKPTYNPTTSQSDEGYPVETFVSDTTQSYPAPETGEEQTRTATPNPTDQAYPSGDETSEEPGEEQEPDPEDHPNPNESKPETPIRWIFLALGGIGGFVLLGVVGVLLAKLKLS